MDDSENPGADEATPKKKVRTRTRATKPRKPKAGAADAVASPELALESQTRPAEEAGETTAPREREPRAPRERKADRAERSEEQSERPRENEDRPAPAEEPTSNRAERRTFAPRRAEGAREEQTQESAGEQHLAQVEKREAETDVPTRYSSDEDPGSNVSDEPPVGAPAEKPQWLR